ncbi:MAG: hypothetical protein ACI8TX_003510 [Hyphomicrobiaceae bacterium]|jgi:hypothetical protein
MSSIDTETARCPHCGEPIELVIDTSVPLQTYVEDCEVCCRPIVVRVQTSSDGGASVAVARENE